MSSRMPRSQASRLATYLSRMSFVARKVSLTTSGGIPISRGSRGSCRPSSICSTSPFSGSSVLMMSWIWLQFWRIRSSRRPCLSLSYFPYSSSFLISPSAELPKNCLRCSFQSVTLNVSTEPNARCLSGVSCLIRS